MAAYSKVPTTWIPSYSSDGTNITIPIASLPGLTVPNAHTSTGDIAEILFALLFEIQAVFATLPTAEQPAYFKAYASKSADAVNDTSVRTYTTRFTTAATGETVLDEV